MCAVSAVHDYFRLNTQPQQWTQPMFNEYQEVIRRLTLLDAKLDQKDCVDPMKAKWMEEVQKRLDSLEKKV